MLPNHSPTFPWQRTNQLSQKSTKPQNNPGRLHSFVLLATYNTYTTTAAPIPTSLTMVQKPLPSKHSTHFFPPKDMAWGPLGKSLEPLQRSGGICDGIGTTGDSIVHLGAFRKPHRGNHSTNGSEEGPRIWRKQLVWSSIKHIYSNLHWHVRQLLCPAVGQKKQVQKSSRNEHLYFSLIISKRPLFYSDQHPLRSTWISGFSKPCSSHQSAPHTPGYTEPLLRSIEPRSIRLTTSDPQKTSVFSWVFIAPSYLGPLSRHRFLMCFSRSERSPSASKAKFHFLFHPTPAHLDCFLSFSWSFNNELGLHDIPLTWSCFILRFLLGLDHFGGFDGLKKWKILQTYTEKPRLIHWLVCEDFPEQSVSEHKHLREKEKGGCYFPENLRLVSLLC